MHVLAIGLNHRTAPIAVRERAAIPDPDLPEALRDLAGHITLPEATIISTCNRTEIYSRAPSNDSAPVIDWLSHHGGFSHEELAPYLYEHHGEAAVRHAFRVACGLDSMVLGEPQILGQMKGAFRTALETGTSGKVLNRLFQKSFAVAKEVRTETAIGCNAVSVAFAAVDLARRLFTSLADQTVLLIGAGDTAELAARHFREHGVRRMIVANRTVQRAQPLAREFGAEAIALTELADRLHEADIVLSSTASPVPVLGKGAVERALRARRHRPIFLVDLAVPRDIEPEVAELRDVYLYTVDDLHNVIERNVAARHDAAREAELIVELQAARFMDWLKSLHAVPTIRRMRQSVDELARSEIERALRRLQRGEDPETVMNGLSRSLTNKFTHAPSEALRRAEREGHRELLAAARTLFRLSGK